MAPNKGRYFRRRWLFLLLSIPYLNILQLFHVQFTSQELYFVRFIPLAGVRSRCYRHRLHDLQPSVVAVQELSRDSDNDYLLFESYFPQLRASRQRYGAQLWCRVVVGMHGCHYYRVGYLPCDCHRQNTRVVLAALGMLMFPLFTVYITNWVQRCNKTPIRLYSIRNLPTTIPTKDS